MSPIEPFVFLGCLELSELLPNEAHDVRQLLEQLGRVPVESIFCHTSAALLHRPVLPEAYPNDFSLWVGTEVRDVRLAERLAAVDPFYAGSMERVREELIATIADHLQHLGAAPTRTQGKRFRFFQSHLVPVPTGHRARDLAEFRDALTEVDVSALFYHTIEARYRSGRGRGDFAEWVGGALGLPELADRLARIDPHAGSLERIRDRHLSVLTEAISGEPS
jgi:truncated hemoglobin YjbI